MADEQLIKPRELPAATSVFADDAIMTDNGVTVGKATPVQLVNAGAPVPTEAEAIAGTDNSKRMTPLTTKQVLDSVTAPSVMRAAAWAESDSPPDPGIPGSKSAKSWASEAERLGADQADRAEAAAADAVNNAPFVVKDAATYFDLEDQVDGARYAAKDGSGAWDYSSGVSSPVVVGADRSYSIQSLHKTPADVDMTDILNDVLSSATASKRVSVVGGPGDLVKIDGRLHIAPFSRLDLGFVSTGGRLNLSTSGRVTQDGRTFLRASIYASGVRSDFAYAFDSDLNTSGPGSGDQRAAFDIAILGNRSAGSKGLLIHSGPVSSGAGVAWLIGRASIKEMDEGVLHLCDAPGGYINENILDYTIFDARNYFTEINDGGNEIDSNVIRLVTQTGLAGRAQRAILSDATKSRWSVKVWDWAVNRLDPAYVGKPSVIFTDKSNYNEGFIDATTVDGFASPALFDAGPSNFLTVSSQRVQTAEKRPRSSNPFVAKGDETDLLYGAGKKLSLTTDFGLSDANGMRNMFGRFMSGTNIPAFTGSKYVTVDLGREIAGTQLTGVEVIFSAQESSSDHVLVEHSANGTTWTPVLKHDNTQGFGRSRFAQRFEVLGLTTARYVRLTLTNDTARAVYISRFALHGSDWTGGGTAGASNGFDALRGPYVLSDNARMFGNVDIRSIAGGEGGGAQNASLSMNGASVMTPYGGPRPTFDNGASVGSAAFRFTEVFAANGTINTSDENEKQQIGAIPDEWLDAWGDVQWQRFKFNEAVDRKGEEARWHIGLVAQQIEAVFSARDLDAFEIGLLCFDEWGDEFNEEGNQTQVAGSRYGVRYSEAQAMEAAWVRRQLSRI